MATPSGPSPTPTLPSCARGLTGADLSAYRDGMPIGGDTGALDAHIVGCPTCRTRMEQFDQLADTLRAERVPEPDERLWQAVCRAAEGAPARRLGMRWPLIASRRSSLSGDKRPLLSGLGALAAVLLLVLGFAQLFALHNASQRVTRLPAPTPLTSVLTWRPVALPQEVMPSAKQGFASSPVDGHVAWICAAVSANSYGLWETTDAGLNWHRTATFSLATGGQPATCTPDADEVNPHAVAIVLSWGSGEAGTLTSSSYYSRDDGAHWQLLHDNVAVEAVGSFGSTTYAVLIIEEGPAPAGLPIGLIASTDGFKTWHDINPPPFAARNGVFRFWAGQQSGEIFAAAYDGTLWYSAASGATWMQLHTPGMQITLGTWIAAQHRWIFCGWQAEILCSTDLGKTWVPQPTFTYTLQCANCGKGGSPYSTTQPCFPSAITMGGALIAACPANGSSPDQPALTTYVLPPDAPAWRSLTLDPGAYAVVVPNSAQVISGEIWWGMTQQGGIAVANAPL